jgi:hypothetical protein
MSDSESLTNYKSLLEEYDKAKALVKEISDITSEVSRCLTTEPYRMTFSTFGMDVPLSPDFAGKPLLCSHNNWPTPESMSQAVNRLYRTEKALRQAFEKLTPDERVLVGPPPVSSK